MVPQKKWVGARRIHGGFLGGRKRSTEEIASLLRLRRAPSHCRWTEQKGNVRSEGGAMGSMPDEACNTSEEKEF